MGTILQFPQLKFKVGDLVYHRLFDYRGVVVEVDLKFRLDNDWYNSMAKSKPPKNKPWYHILVHDASHSTYVAERNLELDSSAMPIEHPLLAKFFTRFEQGRYFRND